MIKIYGADWCIDCVHAKEFLDSKKLQYQYIDISKNNEALLYVEKVNKGKRVIPTLIYVSPLTIRVIPTLIVNGETYINPGIKKLNNLIK